MSQILKQGNHGFITKLRSCQNTVKVSGKALVILPQFLSFICLLYTSKAPISAGSQFLFSDALIRIKQESLAEKNKNWDPADMGALQELVKAKKNLEELGRKRQQLHISFE